MPPEDLQLRKLQIKSPLNCGLFYLYAWQLQRMTNTGTGRQMSWLTVIASRISIKTRRRLTAITEESAGRHLGTAPAIHAGPPFAPKQRGALPCIC